MQREEILSQSDFSPVQIKGLLKILGYGGYGQNGIRQPTYDWEQLAHKKDLTILEFKIKGEIEQIKGEFKLELEQVKGEIKMEIE